MSSGAKEPSEREQRMEAAGRTIYRQCVYCAEVPHGIVSPDCPACLGQGRIQLGAAALSIYEPEVVAGAIEIGLTKAAAEEAETPGSIAATLETLAVAGIIHRPTTPEEQAMTTTHAPATIPAWVDEWHLDNPTASAAGDTPEATPETIELEAGAATIRTYWQDGAPGHHLELPNTNNQLLSNADLRALAEALQDIADEMQTA